MVDLGVLDSGKHAIAVPIENSGERVLRVGPIGSSCSCTVGEAPNQLAPGARGILRATVSVGPGPGSARLSVASNDPTRDQVVHVSWFGRSQPRLVPDSVILSIRSGEIASQDVEVCYAGGGDGAGHLRFVRALNLPDGATMATVAEEPNAIRTIPGLGASAQEAPAMIVGKTVLRLKYQGLLATPLHCTATLVVEQRGTTQELPLAITITPRLALRATPSALMFGAESLANLKLIERKAVIIADTPGSGSLEVARHPDYLNVQLTPTPGSPTRTMLLATVVGDPSVGAQGGEVVLRDARNVELVIPVYLDFHP